MTTLTGIISTEWRDLVMVSYEVDPLLLVPYVPRGTSLDFHNGRALVTVVGLRMLNTRVAGVPVPFHQDLEQVNFRFYVWRQAGSEIRRGVVFLREIVPSAVMTLGARLFLNENYLSAPMRHEVAHAEHGWASYEWMSADRWNRVAARQDGPASSVSPASVEAFVKDRPWGFTRQRDGSTLEYQVEHPSWDVASAIEPALDCDAEAVLGRQFVTTFARPPVSAFVAAGSPATVHPGQLLD